MQYGECGIAVAILIGKTGLLSGISTCCVALIKISKSLAPSKPLLALGPQLSVQTDSTRSIVTHAL